MKFVIVDTTKILKHGNAGFISLQLLTEAVSIIHTEALAKSMEGKAFENLFVANQINYIRLKVDKTTINMTEVTWVHNELQQISEHERNKFVLQDKMWFK